MRSPSLQCNSVRVLKDGVETVITPYEWRGNTYLVCDSIASAFEIMDVFASDSEIKDKTIKVIQILFCEGQDFPVDDLGEFIIDIVWDAFGMDISEDQRYVESEDKVFDWNTDAGRIKASLLQAYNINWDDVYRTTPYAELCSLLGTLTESGLQTPFSQAIYYRTATPPVRTKNNMEQCDAFAEARMHFALENDGESAARQADDMFAMMFAAAGGE